MHGETLKDVFVAVREEHRLRWLGNRVLTKVFGPKREGIKEEWRKVRNEGLLISTSDQIIFGSSS